MKTTDWTLGLESMAGTANNNTKVWLERYNTCTSVVCNGWLPCSRVCPRKYYVGDYGGLLAKEFKWYQSGKAASWDDGKYHVSWHIGYILGRSSQVLTLQSQTNAQVFQIVLNIQNIITRVPGQIDRQQPVYFVDALGRQTPFFLEFITSAEVSCHGFDFALIWDVLCSLWPLFFKTTLRASDPGRQRSKEGNLPFKTRRRIEISILPHHGTRVFASERTSPWAWSLIQPKPWLRIVRHAMRTPGMDLQRMRILNGVSQNFILFILLIYI